MAKSKPGDVTAALNKLYSYGRTYPRGDGPPTARTKDGKFAGTELPTDYPKKADPKQQAVQDPEGKHGPGYDNEVAKNWLRGYGKPHPNFDSGPSGNRYKGK